MAESNGQTADHLIAAIAERPHTFHFFHAVRSLETRFRSHPRVGASVRLEEDFLRFCQLPSLSFAPSSIDGLHVGETAPNLRLFVSFLGLFGPNGPLPQHLTEFARDRLRNAHDPTLVRFMDVFHHRMLSFFYRAWASSEKTVDFDRNEQARFANFFGSLFGLGASTLRDRDAVQDWAKIYFTGRLSNQVRNAEGLEAILGDYFGLPAKVEEFCGNWLKIPSENRCRLGESPQTGSLGVSALVGERKFEAQLKFRVRLGPMEFADFRRLFPNGNSFRRLKDWILNYLNQEFFWDLQCVVRSHAVPGTVLGGEAPLGWATWLKSQPFTHDADDPIFDPEHYA